MLLGIEHVMPMLRPDMAPAAGAERFNRVAARWLLSPSNYTRSLALASVAAGGGVPATIFDMFIGERSQAGEGIADLERWVDELAAPVEAMDREPVRMMLTRGFERRLPLLRAAGVL